MGSRWETVGIVRICDCRMLQYMGGVRWQNREASEEMADRCGVKELDVRLR